MFNLKAVLPLMVALLALSAVVGAQELRRMDVTVTSTNCTGEPVTVFVKDLYLNTPLRAQVKFQLDRYGVWDELFFNWTDATTGTVSYAPTKDADYLISITRPGFMPEERRISTHYCPECVIDSQCARTEYCRNDTCVNVTGICGYASNHQWVRYQCCANSECADDSVCNQNGCVRLVGDCGTAVNHTWNEYDCCMDSDCGAGKKCTDHACVVVNECTVDSECPLDKRCVADKCITLTGECGYASNHQWVPYQCCSDDACPTDYCLDNHTCSSTPRGNGGNPIIPGNGGLGVCASGLLIGTFFVLLVAIGGVSYFAYMAKFKKPGKEVKAHKKKTGKAVEPESEPELPTNEEEG